MIDHSGRARTFYQRKSPDVTSAVNSCPVSCMHYVSFDELQELETARDHGVADDHRHFGHTSTRGYIAPTPLHVARSSSDSNHKSSFYHHFRNKCCGTLVAGFFHQMFRASIDVSINPSCVVCDHRQSRPSVRRGVAMIVPASRSLAVIPSFSNAWQMLRICEPSSS